jgi:alpha-D-ribose 1-methylphosphonate 5-triphosphate synthase subunit PhnH
MQADTLSGGFADPAINSAHAFRSVMEAMARPGTIQDISGAEAPAPLSNAAGAVLLTLCDTDTPVYLAGDADCDAVRAWLAFHTGAPLAGPARCMFAVGSWSALAPLTAYPIGTPDYPDRSATLIVDGADLDTPGATLVGPGIKDRASFSLRDIEAFQANHALFPLGLDFIFTSGDRLAALPRTTEVRRCMWPSKAESAPSKTRMRGLPKNAAAIRT